MAEANREIPVAKIILHATHTHSSANTWGHNPDWRVVSIAVALDELPLRGIEIANSDEYCDFFAAQATAAIIEAWQNREPGAIAWGYGYGVTGKSRRVVYSRDQSKGATRRGLSYGITGHAAMYGSTNHPDFSHYEAGADHFINLLYTFDRDAKLTGAIINVATPSQSSEHEDRLSADYWHDVRQELRRRHGEGLHILPQCAAAGDASPRMLHYCDAASRRFRLKYGDLEGGDHIAGKAERNDIAMEIAAAFDEVLSWARHDLQDSLPLIHLINEVALSKWLITPQEYSLAQEELAELEKATWQESSDPISDFRHNTTLAANRSRLRRLIGRYEIQQSEPRFKTEIHAIRLGDMAFVTNRFELFNDYQHRIQARSPATQTFVVQLAGVPGPHGGTYLATERAAAGKGYSACLYCEVSP